MHTDKIGALTIHHDSYDGDVILCQDGIEIRTQMDTLLEFVGRAIQQTQISSIENLTGIETFNKLLA